MDRLRRYARMALLITAPIAVLLLGGAAALYLYGRQYREAIDARSFIELAIRSVEEAHRLIVAAEQTTAWGRGLLIAGIIMAVIAILCFLITRIKRKPMTVPIGTHTVAATDALAQDTSPATVESEA